MWVSYVVLIFSLFLSTSAGAVDLAEPSPLPPGHFLVKLHRQMVPVKGEGEAVSYKNVYFGTIFLGSPSKQEFSVVFDTGSGHVVVPSTACKSKTCRIHRRYSRKASPDAQDVEYDGTLVKPGEPQDQVTVAYGTGEVTGTFVNERLCLSDAQLTAASEDAVTSKHLRSSTSNEASSSTGGLGSDPGQDCLTLRVVTATDMTHEPFHAFSFDGILGLGLDALTLAPEFSFFGQMVAQGKAAKPTFGVFLSDSEDEEGEICFGGYDPERLETDLLWSPVALPENGYWQVQINAIRIGNRTVDFCKDGQCRALVDTGTSILAVPQDFAGELQDELTLKLRDPPGGADQVTDCKGAEGALLHFDIEGLTVTLTAADYARPSAVLSEDDIEEDGANDVLAGSEAKCQPTLLPIDMPAPIGPKLFIWGEPVLRKFYTVYDLAEKKVGFGIARRSPQDVQPSTSSRKPLLAV